MEQVVLVDTNNNPIGLADKATVHTADTPLHRAFSLFIFNKRGEVLLQRRARSKKTWPGVWSNSVCGHPTLEESPTQAAVRRAAYELGLDIPAKNIQVILPNYQYRYEYLGVVEHEICPVVVTICSDAPQPNPDEVMQLKWQQWSEFVREISQKNAYSQWCVEEALLLEDNEKFKTFFSNIK